MEGIKTLTIEDKLYPKILKEIKGPPKIIYFRGKILPKENCFAILEIKNKIKNLGGNVYAISRR